VTAIRLLRKKVSIANQNQVPLKGGTCNNKENQMENNNQSLDTRQQYLVKLSAFTSTNDVVRLKSALNKALDSGLTINEINEVLAHLYAYVGYPASITGIHLFKEVVNKRQSNGIKDEKGREITPIPQGSTRYERGEKAQMIVTAMSAEQLKTLFAFNPLIDVFLKEHLFADIFDRGKCSSCVCSLAYWRSTKCGCYRKSIKRSICYYTGYDRKKRGRNCQSCISRSN
jgi:alkylhydroperoxidase/carboxymuconolactone decarboxylase family protein YurZ